MTHHQHYHSCRDEVHLQSSRTLQELIQQPDTDPGHMAELVRQMVPVGAGAYGGVYRVTCDLFHKMELDWLPAFVVPPSYMAIKFMPLYVYNRPTNATDASHEIATARTVRNQLLRKNISPYSTYVFETVVKFPAEKARRFVPHNVGLENHVVGMCMPYHSQSLQNWQPTQYRDLVLVLMQLLLDIRAKSVYLGMESRDVRPVNILFADAPRNALFRHVVGGNRTLYLNTNEFNGGRYLVCIDYSLAMLAQDSSQTLGTDKPVTLYARDAQTDNEAERVVNLIGGDVELGRNNGWRDLMWLRYIVEQMLDENRDKCLLRTCPMTDDERADLHHFRSTISSCLCDGRCDVERVDTLLVDHYLFDTFRCPPIGLQYQTFDFLQ